MFLPSNSTMASDGAEPFVLPVTIVGSVRRSRSRKGLVGCFACFFFCCAASLDAKQDEHGDADDDDAGDDGRCPLSGTKRASSRGIHVRGSSWCRLPLAAGLVTQNSRHKPNVSWAHTESAYGWAMMHDWQVVALLVSIRI